MFSMQKEIESISAPAWLTNEDRKAFERFNETTEDGEGYDVPKPMMKRLAEIGVVYSAGFGRFGITTFGRSLLGYTAPPANAKASSPEQDDKCGSGAGCLYKEAKIEALEEQVARLKERLAIVQEPVAWNKPTDAMVEAATNEYDEWSKDNQGTTECIRAMLVKAMKAAPAQPAPVQVDHCIWARNGNTPCPHTQPAPVQTDPDDQAYANDYEATYSEDYAEDEAPAAPVQGPCDMGDICAGCSPRNADGSCPLQLPRPKGRGL